MLTFISANYTVSQNSVFLLIVNDRQTLCGKNRNESHPRRKPHTACLV